MLEKYNLLECEETMERMKKKERKSSVEIYTRVYTYIYKTRVKYFIISGRKDALYKILQNVAIYTQHDTLTMRARARARFLSYVHTSAIFQTRVRSLESSARGIDREAKT